MMRFVLVDEILELSPGISAHGVKTIRNGEDVFLDHFPGFAVVPGVLLTEMMAQLGGKCFDAGDTSRKAMLVQIRKASFRRWVRPDECAHIFATVTASGPEYGSATCRIDVHGSEAATADLLFSFLSRSSFAPGYCDEVLDRFLRRGGKTSAESR